LYAKLGDRGGRYKWSYGVRTRRSDGGAQHSRRRPERASFQPRTRQRPERFRPSFLEGSGRGEVEIENPGSLEPLGGGGSNVDAVLDLVGNRAPSSNSLSIGSRRRGRVCMAGVFWAALAARGRFQSTDPGLPRRRSISSFFGSFVFGDARVHLVGSPAPGHRRSRGRRPVTRRKTARVVPIPSRIREGIARGKTIGGETPQRMVVVV